MLRSSLLFCFLIATVSLWGQTATIRGRAADYAGREISFYTIPEPISHQQKMLATARIGQDGSFDLILSTSQPIEVYTDLEKFRGTLVVVTRAQYQITLPPFSPRTVQESASPYFEPELYWLGIKDTKPSDLNFLVRAFLTDYNRELAAHTMDIYQKKSADTVHAIVARLEKSYPTGKVNYLNTLKTYSYAELEYLIAPTEKELIIQIYFATK